MFFFAVTNARNIPDVNLCEIAVFIFYSLPDRQRDRQTDRQTDIQTYRQTDRQTDRQTLLFRLRSKQNVQTTHRTTNLYFQENWFQADWILTERLNRRAGHQSSLLRTEVRQERKVISIMMTRYLSPRIHPGLWHPGARKCLWQRGAEDSLQPYRERRWTRWIEK